MHKTLIPFEQVPQLSRTDVAYITADKNLQPFYKYSLDNQVFNKIVADKKVFPDRRAALVAVLREQYRTFPEMELVSQNIKALAESGTYTVCTAHQPCLFLGPLYFIYKTITTINLAEAALSLVSKGQKVVPVFVLGSEDHDIEEVNSIQIFNKKLTWNPEAEGAVGSMSTESIRPLLSELREIMGAGDHAETLMALFENAYNGQRNVAEATQYILHGLFGHMGLVVLNMNDRELKRFFIPVMKAEIKEQVSKKLVDETVQRLNDLGFKTQAAPRAINLFYLMPGMRERIVLEDGVYKVNNTDLVFTEAAMLDELDAHPERFSPNVILRPLFQEMILPNLAYVGGGGELAYWLERKSLFEHFGVNFPLLVRRNSVLWVGHDQLAKMQKFGLPASRFFSDIDSIIKQYVIEISDSEISISGEIAAVKNVFNKLVEKAVKIDAGLEAAVRAEETRQIGALQHLEGRLHKAEKQKHEVSIQQIRSLYEKLFPGGGLQERSDNFIPWYLKYGTPYFEALRVNLRPIEKGFVILEEK